MKKTRKTKIIATLGPSCSSPTTIEEMMVNGVELFRINFSHSNNSEIEKIISTIRFLNKKNNIYFNFSRFTRTQIKNRKC